MVAFLLCLHLQSLHAASPQFQLGDTLSVFSDRAFRKDQGNVLEAIGNVVVVNQKDTLYGESASLDRRTMIFRVDGNVRYVTQDITLYGSHLEYHVASGYAEIDHARIIHPQFNIVARKLRRINERVIETQEAEFTTCRDCTESWSVYGKKMVIYLDDKVEITGGLARIKGTNILYLPFFVVPLSNRKSGILAPLIYSRSGEGLGLGVPVFWNINTDKDATVTPTFWAKRGYGSDLQYRQRFAPERWFEGNGRYLNDTIYRPGKMNDGISGSDYTRYFSEVENHWMWSPNWVHHLRYASTKDLDMMRDFQQYTENRMIGSDLGFTGFMDGRGERWSISFQGEYLRNQLFNDATEFDRSYVQTLPRIAFGTTPYSLYQSNRPFMRHILLGVDSSFSRFRRVDTKNTNPIREADRITANPYITTHLMNWGPVAFKNTVKLDYQKYHFPEEDDARGAEKNATLMTTEASFTMDRIFGLAYEERIPTKDLPKELIAQQKKNSQAEIKPLSSSQGTRKLIGSLAEFETGLNEDGMMVARHAYRHSQEFKLIHHFISSEHKSGNADFLAQITNNRGWFDYTDAVRSQEYLLGANTTRSQIPAVNNLELQWNNTLIRKSPRATDWRTDQRYLRDNFNYTRIGYFNVSQGYLLDDEFTEIRQRLTRLAILAGYTTLRWSLSASEYFFHADSQHIFQMGWQRNFDFMNILASYSFNSISPTGQSKVNTVGAGFQVKPSDALGFTYYKRVDLEESRDLRTTYTLDIMPSNNCWILNFNYEEAVTFNRFWFGFDINFGQERFSQYRQDWFRFQRN